MDDPMSPVTTSTHQRRAGSVRGSRGLIAAAALGLTVLAAAGCGSGHRTAAATPPTGPASAPTAPTATPPAAEPVGDSRSTATTARAGGGTASDGTDLTDGRHPALLRRVDASGRRITVDVVQLYFGAAADHAAREDGSRDIPPPNGYWIRNVSSRLRTLPVAAGADITVNVHGFDVTGSSTTNLSRSLAQLAAIRHLDTGVFWLTLAHGQVTGIAEQYLP
jgi:hypothetical protein